MAEVVSGVVEVASVLPVSDIFVFDCAGMHFVGKDRDD